MRLAHHSEAARNWPALTDAPADPPDRVVNFSNPRMDHFCMTVHTKCVLGHFPIEYHCVELFDRHRIIVRAE